MATRIGMIVLRVLQQDQANNIVRYMQGFKCKVTGAVGDTKVAKAKPSLWCANDYSKCRKGAKQMVVFNGKSSWCMLWCYCFHSY